ncbi:hypothetical protein [Kitasatospora griseola]|uniref:hypothetical protein n=1 Tax=Kitasatospora griseola TaxID=2064 RepID=UPI0036539A73
MRALACADCGKIPEQATTGEYGSDGRQDFTRRPGGRCWDCHLEHLEKEAAAARERLHQARAANAELRPCWTCRGSIGGEEDSELELTEKAGPDRLECPGCEHERQEKGLGPLVLPVPTRREQMAALVSTPADPWWDVRVPHAKLYPAKERAA